MAQAAPDPDNADALRWALRQWRSANRLFDRMRQRVTEINPRTNVLMLRNTFGRWLQTIQLYNWEQLDDHYPLFPRQPLNDNTSRDELVRMLRDIAGGQEIELVDEMLQMIHQFITGEHEINDDSTVLFEEDHNGHSGHIVVGGLRTPHCPRISCLVHNFGEVETALVCLRYHHLSLFRGGESGMSVTALNALHYLGHATHEGFASPLNCRLLGRPDIKFCSLFEDTDSSFGSLGNFFRINLSDHPGGWILNPPFVEPVMDETARRVVRILQEAEPGSFWFFITFPRWQDNDGWQMLDQCEMKVARLDFEARTFLQQDCYGEIYRPDVRLCIFVFGELPEDVNLVELRNRIADETEESVTRDWLVACDVEE